MRKSITQQQDFGCGIACFAFAANISYKQAETWLGKEQANSKRFYIKDFRNALKDYGLSYSSRHIKPRTRHHTHQEGSIVLIRRSKHYLAGHYLIRYQKKWMDPWINLPLDKNIDNAKSGFRKRLPGSAMYVLYPG